MPDETTPGHLVETVARAVYDAERSYAATYDVVWSTWDRASQDVRLCCRRQARAAIESLGHESYVRSAPLTRLYRWMLAGWHDRSGVLRPVEDVVALTDRAVDAYLRQQTREAMAHA